MRVGDRNGEGVGRVRASDPCAGKQARDHRVDLRLFRPAGSDHSLLDQSRRIFANRDTAARRAEQDGTSGLAQLQRRLWIFVDEHLFDRRALGPVLPDDGSEPIVKVEETHRKIGLRVGPDLTVGNVAQPVPFGGDDTPAGAGKPGIETDEDQPNFSITASETS